MFNVLLKILSIQKCVNILQEKSALNEQLEANEEIQEALEQKIALLEARLESQNK